MNIHFHYQLERMWKEIHRKYQYNVVMNKYEVVFKKIMKLIDKCHKYFYNGKYYEDVQ